MDYLNYKLGEYILILYPIKPANKYCLQHISSIKSKAAKTSK